MSKDYVRVPNGNVIDRREIASISWNSNEHHYPTPEKGEELYWITACLRGAGDRVLYLQRVDLDDINEALEYFTEIILGDNVESVPYFEPQETQESEKDTKGSKSEGS